MPDKKMTLKDRRIDSDRRIIAAAIKRFGQLGYTYSSIRDIAKGAGITSGLITQRYGTKENLFLTAYTAAMEGAFSDVDPAASPRECLYSIINDIEKLSEEKPEVFEFCCMLHDATDYPKEILKPHQEQMKKKHVYLILKDAQKMGMLPPGNLDVLLAAFGATVFQNIRLCKRYHLAYTAADKFLEFIRFCDAKTMREAKWHRVLETAISNTFDLLIYVNIEENKGEILRCADSFSVYGDFSDVRRSAELTIEQMVRKEERQRVREYLDLDTLGERMKGRKSLSIKIIEKDGMMLVHSFLPLTWDENGNLVEVFSGVYRVRPDGFPE